MAFTTIPYLLFLPLCLAVVFLVPDKLKNVFLLAASWFFYLCAGSPGYVVFLWLGTLASYLFGRLLEKPAPRKKRLAFLWAGIGFQLLALLFFKYAGLFTNFFALWGQKTGFLYTAADAAGVVSLIAPLGISYYTFQTVGYLADVYHKKVPAEHDLITYALFVSFFPQITAGPIGRAGSLLPQLNGRYRFDAARTVSALRLMLLGFFKKIAVADMLAMYLNVVYAGVEKQNGMTLFFMPLCYMFWLYCDFSGYSDIALGSARLFGIDLIQNFDTPFFSRSVQEFWRRWHVSLSSWLRDYVYFPLGGSRCSHLRHYVNLAVTFLLSGLWHGAGPTFLVWGALFAVFQLAEAFLHQFYKKPPLNEPRWKRILKTAGTYWLVSFCFIFFRAATLDDALHIMTGQFFGWNIGAFLQNTLDAVGKGFNSTPLLTYAYLAFCLLCAAVVIFMDWYRCFKLGNGDLSQGFSKLKPAVRWVCYYALLALVFAAFLMNNGYYGGGASTAYAGF
ncbi:MAG: MBOAT family O-acyltransferase [Oscillospiraceae bacterium]|nr:MBOAT family O-acyltransferase [Oscillospiraceae bacterium]